MREDLAVVEEDRALELGLGLRHPLRLGRPIGIGEADAVADQCVVGGAVRFVLVDRGDAVGLAKGGVAGNEAAMPADLACVDGEYRSIGLPGEGVVVAAEFLVRFREQRLDVGLPRAAREDRFCTGGDVGRGRRAQRLHGILEAAADEERARAGKTRALQLPRIRVALRDRRELQRRALEIAESHVEIADLVTGE